jgi:formate dehydrogenase major subunit
MEAHPVGSRWAMKARERGAKIIHVDPHYSRTSAMADIHLQIRAGSDIAFLGGLIRHIIETESYFREYVVNYTNAATIVGKDFRDTEDLDGLFSGFDPEDRNYNRSTWMYEGGEVAASAGVREHSTQAFSDRTGAGMMTGAVKSDETLTDPRCVFQIMKRHYARYTPEMVEKICGITKEDFLRVADTLIENSGRERTSVLTYALGWTQHSSGVQMIRAGAIVQLLLGNIGRPGGGVMAMRGHASIQGSSDIPTLYELLPGYLPMPRANENDLDLEGYIESGSSNRGWWSHFDEYIVSLCKAWFGDSATAENDYGFPWLPKISGNHSHYVTTNRALDGKLDGFFVMGQNPAVGSANAGAQRLALSRIKWLVVRDLAELETASFWKDSPEIQSGELRTEDIATEVFLMPAASHIEKAGHFTNTQRLLQYRDKAMEPPGDARSELHFMHHLAKRVMAHYADSDDPKDWPLQHLKWDYPEEGETAEPHTESVLKEIGGYDMDGGRPLNGFSEMAADGSTACGCWIYAGCFADGVNQPRRRDPGDIDDPEGGWVSPEWGWAWPANRRILYSRASADPEGNPWSERKKYVWWDREQGKWTGYDVPDFPVDKAPDYRAPDDAEGMDAISGDDPFIMMGDGRAWLYTPSGLLDGPLPTHYEPFESPVENLLYPKVDVNPVALRWEREENKSVPPEDHSRFPLVGSTFRLTEHHTAGAMSRNLPWLAELQPEMFVEMDPQLAAERGVEDGDWVTVTSARANIEARAKVTSRIQPLQLGDRVVHQVCMPWHWGYFRSSEQGVTGDAANDLVPMSGDPNVSIQESKAFRCDIRPGRK